MINSDFVKKRVVIYARVSTEHEAQISALEIRWIGTSQSLPQDRNGLWSASMSMKA